MQQMEEQQMEAEPLIRSSVVCSCSEFPSQKENQQKIIGLR